MIKKSPTGPILLLLLVWGLHGCSKSTAPSNPPKTDTGAEKTAKSFFEALLHEEWSAAYDLLDSTSREWCGKEDFTSRAKATMSQLSFTPTEVAVAVTETEDAATAVANFRGISGTSSIQHKDGTALRRTSKGWAVILRKNFGDAATAPPPKVGAKEKRKGKERE